MIRTTKHSALNRPVSTGLAVKVAALMLSASAAIAGVSTITKPGQAHIVATASASNVKPFILPVDWQEQNLDAATHQPSALADNQNCREVTVKVENRDGLRNDVVRSVCRTIL